MKAHRKLPALFFMSLLLLNFGPVTKSLYAQDDISRYLPFDMPAYEELVESEKKVFPHWHYFKVSWDNKDPEDDFYDNNLVVPHGPFPHKGRQRPLPRPVREGSDWMVQDMVHEVKLAKAIGCDGFWMNHFGKDNRHVEAMLEAAKRVDSPFKILLAKDVIGYRPRSGERTIERRGEPVDYYSGLYKKYGKHPYAYRVGDKLAITGFASMYVDVEEWKEIFGNLRAEGMDVYFLPNFMSWKKYYKDYAGISEGFGDWGGRSYPSYKGFMDAPEICHEMGKKWVMPVPTQDIRIENTFYWEAKGSQLFRNYWRAAIEGDADWVQIVTWNDYSEGTEIAPSTGTQYAFYDLSAYYTVWFKTGKQPEIVRDVLYYFHRTQFSDADPTEGERFSSKDTEPADIIELLGFLKEPGTLVIEIGGKTYTKEAGYGITSFKVPLQYGTPVFKLIRDDQEVIRLESAFTVLDEPVLMHDPWYKAGSSSRDVVPMTGLYKRFFDLSEAEQ